MVRVSKNALIRLQREALHAAALELEMQATRARVLQAEAEGRAVALLDSVCPPADGGGAVMFSEVLSDVPLTREGRLHEPALLSLGESVLWRCRDQELAQLIGSTSLGDAR